MIKKYITPPLFGSCNPYFLTRTSGTVVLQELDNLFGPKKCQLIHQVQVGDGMGHYGIDFSGLIGGRTLVRGIAEFFMSPENVVTTTNMGLGVNMALPEAGKGLEKKGEAVVLPESGLMFEFCPELLKDIEGSKHIATFPILYVNDVAGTIKMIQELHPKGFKAHDNGMISLNYPEQQHNCGLLWVKKGSPVKDVSPGLHLYLERLHEVFENPPAGLTVKEPIKPQVYGEDGGTLKAAEFEIYLGSYTSKYGEDMMKSVEMQKFVRLHELREGKRFTLNHAQALVPTLQTDDLPKAKEFFLNVLDAKIIYEKGPAHVSFLYSTEEGVETVIDVTTMMGGMAKNKDIPKKTKIQIYVKDVDAAFKKAIDSGYAKVTDIIHHPWGERCGAVSVTDDIQVTLATFGFDLISPENREMLYGKWALENKALQKAPYAGPGCALATYQIFCTADKLDEMIKFYMEVFFQGKGEIVMKWENTMALLLSDTKDYNVVFMVEEDEYQSFGQLFVPNIDKMKGLPKKPFYMANGYYGVLPVHDPYGNTFFVFQISGEINGSQLHDWPSVMDDLTEETEGEPKTKKQKLN